MNWFLHIPLAVRLGGLFVAGAAAGSLANWAIYQLCWFPRPLSPWSRRDARLADRVPILGWLAWRHRAGREWSGFWIRPLLIEFALGIAAAALYCWECDARALVPRTVVADGVAAWILHANYAAHMLLILLLVVASFIDIDEKTIPDTITVPGTLLALLLAAAMPQSLLPVSDGARQLDFLRLSPPGAWPAVLDGFPNSWSLTLGVACFWAWCFALLPRRWRGRRGWRVALALIAARIAREPVSASIAVMAAVGASAIALVWWWGAPAGANAGRWQALLTALVGMVISGGLVWCVRLIGAAVLKREAMGFGDVTLMAMIGAFLGWQASLMIFFIAPFLAIAIGVAQLIIHRETEIPYGPFLCMAAIILVVRWEAVWNWAQPMFAFGWLVPAVMLVCLVLMGLLLGLWQLILSLFSRRRAANDS